MVLNRTKQQQKKQNPKQWIMVGGFDPFNQKKIWNELSPIIIIANSPSMCWNKKRKRVQQHRPTKKKKFVFGLVVKKRLQSLESPLLNNQTRIE
jgi:hypothetical protein